MNVSVFSLLMSVLWSSLIILVAHLLRRKAFFLRRVGAPVLVVFYLLSVGRMVLPVEFPFSREVPLRSWFSTAVQAVCIEEHQLGDFGWTWAQAACVCWAAVGIILLLWFSFRYWRAVRRMTQSLARDPLVEEILQSIRKESKRSLKVQVFRTERASTPMGVGIFRRKIILPCGDIPQRELEYILRHEYTHFLHGDLWVKLLTQVYCCLFWWNPLVYLLRRDLPQILEIRCDMAVTKDYTVSQKAEYLQTIVNSLKRMGKERDTSRQFLVSARLLASEDSLSLVERFRLISGGQEPRRLLAASLVTGALCLLFVSYLVIFQSAYDPPEEDVYNGAHASIVVPDIGEVSLIRQDDGTFAFDLGNGQRITMHDQNLLSKLLEQGVQIKEE